MKPCLCPHCAPTSPPPHYRQRASELDDVLLAAFASLAAFGGVLAGKRWSLDLSARLFVIAFVLVSFSSQEGTGAVWYGVVGAALGGLWVLG